MTESEQLYRSALSLYRERDFPRAAELAQQAVTADPQMANGWRLRADCYMALDNADGAIECLQRAREATAPESSRWVSASLHLAETLLRGGRVGDARILLDQVAFTGIEHVEPLARGAYLYSLCEAHRESLELYERALGRAPKNRELLFNCASANRAMGNMDRAEALYDQMLAQYPDDFEAYKNRSDLRRQTADDNHIDELVQCLTQSDLPAAGASQLQFALAKEYEDLGAFEQSFAALTEACRLRRSLIRYDADQDLRRLRDIGRVFDLDFFRQSAASQSASSGEGIIFILGMPRTGTTLVDRVLCSADGVYSAGEPGIFARLLTELAPAGMDGEDFVRRARATDFAELGRRYETELRRRSEPGAQVIIDKNPMNFLYAGLIHHALPAAKIVHLCRHAVDTGYAILKTQFRNAYPFSYDQRELANYYLGYRALMKHWHGVIPARIYDLHYEKLVQDLAGESRELFKFCALPWSEQVLNFHKQDKQGTATASASQVRQPVYTSSIGKWKNYRKGLQPLLEVLREGGIEIE